MSENPLSAVLRSLSPRNGEELILLRALLTGVRAMHRRVYADLGYSGLNRGNTVSLSTGYRASEELLAAIPAGDKRYFDGLVEAFEVYQTIHGEAFPVDSQPNPDMTLGELRRIRDLCLQRGLAAA